MVIKYLQHKEIDKKKWDECIENAHNSLIYVHSFYLDNCTNYTWDALVVGDYEIVMPLTFRKKYGINYLYQPAFLQQAGIFSAKKIDEIILNFFIKEIIKHFNFAEINLNFKNNFFSNQKIEITERNNFVLPLHNTYKNISLKFTKHFIRNIHKAGKYNFEYEKVYDADEVINMYKELYQSRFLSVKENDYEALKKNCKWLLHNNNIVLRKASINTKVFAAIILLKDAKRLYNIAPSVTEEGRKLSANHFLFSKVIEEFSWQNLLFDFEGSDIKGIADFYKSMNPINEKYVAIKYNNLSRLVKLFKK